MNKNKLAINGIEKILNTGENDENNRKERAGRKLFTGRNFSRFTTLFKYNAKPSIRHTDKKTYHEGCAVYTAFKEGKEKNNPCSKCSISRRAGGCRIYFAFRRKVIMTRAKADEISFCLKIRNTEIA